MKESGAYHGIVEVVCGRWEMEGCVGGGFLRRQHGPGITHRPSF